MADQNSFTDWLIEEMDKRGWTQADLARKSGLGKSVINKIVNRRLKRTDWYTFVAIAKALDVSQVSVFRTAGILSPDTELPILEDFKFVLLKLSPDQRELALTLVKAMAEHVKTVKGSQSQE